MPALIDDRPDLENPELENGETAAGWITSRDG